MKLEKVRWRKLEEEEGESWKLLEEVGQGRRKLKDIGGWRLKSGGG